MNMPTIRATDRLTPLAHLLRPTSINDVLGQQHLIGPNGVLRKMVESRKITSSILWGPPGIGKTTIAKALAADIDANFVVVNATSAKVDELRKILKEAKIAQMSDRQTICFIDECLPYHSTLYCRLPDGSFIEEQIGEIVRRELKCDVLSYDIETKVHEWQPIESWSKIASREMIEIEVRYEGEIFSLRCSLDHRVYTIDRGYISAQYLNEDDKLLFLDYGSYNLARLDSHPCKVSSIRQLPNPEPLFDIGVKKNHNFFANDILVHNCHRFSTSQQDVLLPGVEDGTIVMFGATTENPKFAINGTLISRSMIYELKPLTTADMAILMVRIKKFYADRERNLDIDQTAAITLIKRCSGDARKLVTAMETIVEVLTAGGDKIESVHVDAAMPNKHLVFDKSGNEHYDSAKSFQSGIQHSDVNGVVYWLAQWIAAGEDPAYISRRMLVTAWEDCASNPMAPLLAMAADYTVERIGLPECLIPMAYAAITMAQSERNKTAFRAINNAMRDVEHNATVYIPPENRAGNHSEYASVINKQYVTQDIVERALKIARGDVKVEE